jgi:excisionase family DNA binding protein
MEANDTLTTGQVAKICSVAPRTVSKWFDSGQLRGYRIPGSKDRRIPLAQLVRFMKAHGIPLNGLDGHQGRVLVVDPDEALTQGVQRALEARGNFNVECASCVFSAGAMTERMKPHVLLIDVGIQSLDPAGLCRYFRAHEDLQAACIVGMGAALSPTDRQALLQAGFESTLEKPFDAGAVVRAVEQAMSIVT